MTQLCVTIPALALPQGGEVLAAALHVAKVAAVVIVAPEGDAIAPAAALPLIAQAQKAGAAALISGDAQLARVLRADGVHLPWSPDVVAMAIEAREILGQGGIVGADAGSSRHAAMELGEQGVDYVAFGPAVGLDREAAKVARHDLVAWWADLFEIPVVAMSVDDAAEAKALVAADADFVSVPIGPDGDLTDLSTCAAALTAADTAPAA
jgi:thiamine-phosphate pyrophosphorylase